MWKTNCSFIYIYVHFLLKKWLGQGRTSPVLLYWCLPACIFAILIICIPRCRFTHDRTHPILEWLLHVTSLPWLLWTAVSIWFLGCFHGELWPLSCFTASHLWSLPDAVAVFSSNCICFTIYHRFIDKSWDHGYDFRQIHKSSVTLNRQHIFFTSPSIILYIYSLYVVIYIYHQPFEYTMASPGAAVFATPQDPSSGAWPRWATPSRFGSSPRPELFWKGQNHGKTMENRCSLGFSSFFGGGEHEDWTMEKSWTSCFFVGVQLKLAHQYWEPPEHFISFYNRELAQ